MSGGGKANWEAKKLIVKGKKLTKEKKGEGDAGRRVEMGVDVQEAFGRYRGTWRKDTISVS